MALMFLHKRYPLCPFVSGVYTRVPFPPRLIVNTRLPPCFDAALADRPRPPSASSDEMAAKTRPAPLFRDGHPATLDACPKEEKR